MYRDGINTMTYFNHAVFAHFATEFLHFCWRQRSAPVHEPEIDLLMMPADGHLVEYTLKENKNFGSGIGTALQSPTNGRVITLKFASSSQKYLFWLQSKSQHPDGNPSLFGRRDHKLIHIVNMLLDSRPIDVAEELRKINENEGYTSTDNEASRVEGRSGVQIGEHDPESNDIEDGGATGGNR